MNFHLHKHLHDGCVCYACILPRESVGICVFMIQCIYLLCQYVMHIMDLCYTLCITVLLLSNVFIIYIQSFATVLLMSYVSRKHSVRANSVCRTCQLHSVGCLVTCSFLCRVSP